MTKSTSQNPEASQASGATAAPDYFSVDQVVKKTGLSRSTIYNYMTADVLKFIKAGSRRLIEVSAYENFKAILRSGQLATCA